MTIKQKLEELKKIKSQPASKGIYDLWYKFYNIGGIEYADAIVCPNVDYYGITQKCVGVLESFFQDSEVRNVA